MRVGLHVLGIGAGARRAVIDAVARSAEDAGFATLWAGEHVVMVDEPRSTYPYAADGRIPVDAGADWLDPVVALSFAAAATERIRLATGVLLLPEHQPVLVAKQAASLDVLSGGRLVLGVGIGWSAEEYAALGVPFAGRAARLVESVAVLRTLWRDDPATFAGPTVTLERVRVRPAPPRGRIPIYLGGNSDPALRRAATLGDGWYGFNLSVAEAAERVSALAAYAAEAGRDPAALEVVVAPRRADPAEAAELARVGVDEAVVVAEPPEPDDAPSWVGELARAWHVVPSAG